MYKPISTYTGRHFDPYHAVAADLDVRDIAHAQSLMTRANGHFPDFTPWGSTLWLAPERRWCGVKRTKRHCFACSMTAQRRI